MGSKIGALSDKKFNLILFTLVTVASVFYVFYLHKELDGGFVAGADWNVPATKQQYERALEIFTSTWSDSWYLGLRNSTHTNLWYIVFTYILSRIFTDITYIPLIVIALIQASALLTTFHFLRDLGVSRLGGLAGGIFLATSPIMFNYLIMGWIYVLFAFSFLNLSLIFIKKSLETQRLSFSAVAGIFFGLSLAQSQAILWLPLVVTIYVLVGGFTVVSLKRKFLSVLIYIGVGLLINAHTITNLIFYPNPTLLDAKILTSGVSLGTSVHATPVNIIRLFGSNFNKPYENTQNTMVGVSLSFLLPVLIAMFLINKDVREEKKYLPFLLLFFTSMLSLFLDSNRELLEIMPGGAIFRDTARFSFVSTFAATILLALITDVSRSRSGLVKSVSLFAVALLLYTTARPWLEGELTKQPQRGGPDIRLRAIAYPYDYYEIEGLLDQDGDLYNVLYLPTGGVLDVKSRPDFNGPYREIADVFAGYSKQPGMIRKDDRDYAETAGIEASILKKLGENKLVGIDVLLATTSTKYVLIRMDAEWAHLLPTLRYFDNLVGNKKAILYYKGDVVRVYKIGGAKPLIFPLNEGTLENEDATSATTNITDLQKVTPTLYTATITNTAGLNGLLFNQRYNEGWVINLCSGANGKPHTYNTTAYRIDHKGYVNAWFFNNTASTDGITKNSCLVKIVYSPQRYYNLSTGVAGVVVLVVLSYHLILYRKKGGTKTRCITYQRHP